MVYLRVVQTADLMVVLMVADWKADLMVAMMVDLMAW